MATAGAPSNSGRRLARLRAQAGLTAAQLADLVPDESVTKTVITNVESGRKRDLTATELAQFASALGVSPLALLVDGDLPWEPIEIEHLAEPYASMSTVEYILAADLSDPWLAPSAITPNGIRVLRLMHRLRSLERDLDEILLTFGARERTQPADEIRAVIERPAAGRVVLTTSSVWSDENLDRMVQDAIGDARALRTIVRYEAELINAPDWFVRRVDSALATARQIHEESDPDVESDLTPLMPATPAASDAQPS